jgi:hypothetical protein
VSSKQVKIGWILFQQYLYNSNDHVERIRDCTISGNALRLMNVCYTLVNAACAQSSWDSSQSSYFYHPCQIETYHTLSSYVKIIFKCHQTSFLLKLSLGAHLEEPHFLQNGAPNRLLQPWLLLRSYCFKLCSYSCQLMKNDQLQCRKFCTCLTCFWLSIRTLMLQLHDHLPHVQPISIV